MLTYVYWLFATLLFISATIPAENQPHPRTLFRIGQRCLDVFREKVLCCIFLDFRGRRNVAYFFVGVGVPVIDNIPIEVYVDAGAEQQ